MNKGVKLILDGGTNDYIQAVLQCFMAFDMLALFYLEEKYENDEKYEPEVSEGLRQVFIDMFRTPLACLEEYQT